MYVCKIGCPASYILLFRLRNETQDINSVFAYALFTLFSHILTLFPSANCMGTSPRHPRITFRAYAGCLIMYSFAVKLLVNCERNFEKLKDANRFWNSRSDRLTTRLSRLFYTRLLFANWCLVCSRVELVPILDIFDLGILIQ